MIVLDTSALVAALVGRPLIPGLENRLNDARSLHAPHLLDIEFLAAVRGLVFGGVVSPDRAADAITDFQRMPIVRYAASPLVSQIWALRQNLTAYDANFLALASALACPLVTCDNKFSFNIGVKIEVY